MAIQFRARILAQQSHVITSRARISIQTSHTFTGKSRIAARTTRTMTSRAWILGPYHISIRGRISRQQGWPIADPIDVGFSLWQDTRLDLRTRILHYIAFPTQTIRIKGRVTYDKTLGMQSQARIVTAQFLQMRANILPRFFTVQVAASFRVQRTSQTRLRVVFYIRGRSQNWQFTSKARIVKASSSRMTGHFIVAMPGVFDTALSIESPVT